LGKSGNPEKVGKSRKTRELPCLTRDFPAFSGSPENSGFPNRRDGNFKSPTRSRKVGFPHTPGRNFLSMYADLGVNPQKPYFEVESSKIFVFFDSPHLIKSARNCLFDPKNEITFDGGVVRKSDIEKLYNYESSGKF